jgi:hypothetical protein
VGSINKIIGHVSPGIEHDPMSKITKAKQVQVAKHLPNKHRVLSSNCSTKKYCMLKRDISKEHLVKQ